MRDEVLTCPGCGVRLLAPTQEGVVTCPRCRCQWIWRRDLLRSVAPADEATLILCRECGQGQRVPPTLRPGARLCPLCKQPWVERSETASTPVVAPIPDGRTDTFAATLQRSIATAAAKVHWRLGGNAAQDGYLSALKQELRSEGLAVASNREFPVHYDDVEIRQRVDLIVEELIVVELVSAQEVLENAAYLGRLRVCMQLAGKSHGLLVRFAREKLTVLPLFVPAQIAGAG